MAAAQKPAELRAAVEDDLRQLGIDRIHVVNLRRLDLGPGVQAEGDQIVDLDDQLAELIALREEGKIGAIGDQRACPSTCSAGSPRRDRLRAERLQPARPFAGGNAGRCVAEDIAWVPFFPLGSSFAGFPKVAENPVVIERRR